MVLAKIGVPLMGEIILTLVIVVVDWVADCIGQGVQEVASRPFRHRQKEEAPWTNS